MGIAPDVPYEIGDYAFGGYVAGVIDTTQGNIDAADASQTGERYVLIVAPKSLETTKEYRTSNTAGATAAKTRWDGLTATAAMDTAFFPAAQYCAGLTPPSDAGSGWYLPAMDELEVVYRNLKPTTESNSTLTRDGGAFPGGTVEFGVNPSSDPQSTTAYTSSNPARTTVSAFQSGAAQALESTYYRTATERDSSYSWNQSFTGSVAGMQAFAAKTTVYAVRPVRRVLVSDLNQPPDAPILTTPADASLIDRNVSQRFDWDFSDPDPGDSQSAYNLRYRVVGAATWTETGWTSTPNTYHDIAGGTFTDATDYEWQAATKDAQGVEGPFSASWLFTAENPLLSAILNTVTETSTAQPLARVKSKALGVSMDTTTAQPWARQKTKALGVVTETTAAQPIVTRPRIVVALGVAAEAVTAMSFTASQRYPDFFFSPPVRWVGNEYMGEKPYRYFRHQVSMSVVYRNGHYQEVRVVDDTGLTEGETWFPGGRTHRVTEEQRLLLEADGFTVDII